MGHATNLLIGHLSSFRLRRPWKPCALMQMTAGRHMRQRTKHGRILRNVTLQLLLTTSPRDLGCGVIPPALSGNLDSPKMVNARRDMHRALPITGVGCVLPQGASVQRPSHGHVMVLKGHTLHITSRRFG